MSHPPRPVRRPASRRPTPGSVQGPATWQVLGAALAVGFLTLAATQAAAWSFGEPVAVLTRDPQTTADVAWYTGSVAVFTDMAWAVVAACTLLAAWLVPQERARLVALGVLAVVLGADDALLLHDEVGPINGVPQEAFLAGYALAALLLLVPFLRRPRTASSGAFLFGAALLGLSIVADQLSPGLHLFEDGAKLLGVLLWTTVPVLALRDWRRAGQPTGS